jgi:hypothetical protein
MLMRLTARDYRKLHLIAQRVDGFVKKQVVRMMMYGYCLLSKVQV